MISYSLSKYIFCISTFSQISASCHSKCIFSPFSPDFHVQISICNPYQNLCEFCLQTASHHIFHHRNDMPPIDVESAWELFTGVNPVKSTAYKGQIHVRNPKVSSQISASNIQWLFQTRKSAMCMGPYCLLPVDINLFQSCDGPSGVWLIT